MKTKNSADAVRAFNAQLETMTPEARDIGQMFRPWEWYQLDEREIYVRVVGIDPSGQLIDVQREDGRLFTVTPYQIELAALYPEDLPADRLYQATKVA